MRALGLSSLTGFVRVVIYLAYWIALIWLLYSIGAFIYTMVNADDLSNVAMTNTYELPALRKDLEGNVWETKSGEIRLRLYKLYGEFSYLNMPRALVLAAFLKVVVMCALFIIGIIQIARMFENVSRGKPFVRENARRLRIVGYTMAGGAIFKLLIQTETFLLFMDAIEMEGAQIPWSWLIRENLNLGLLFGGLVVLVISEVFRLGNRLQEEQELTV